MKICFILEHFFPHIGGSEMMFMEMAHHLTQMGCEVKVATSHSGGILGRRSYGRVEVHYFPWRNLWGHPVPKKKDLTDFVKWADIVHTSIHTAAPIASALSKKFNKPCVLTVHEVLGKKWFWVENPLKALLFRLYESFELKRSYTLYHAVSEATKRDLLKEKISPTQVVMIPLGIKRTFLQTPPHMSQKIDPVRTFLYFGRAGKTKGLNVLLAAIEQVKEQLPSDIRFLFILSHNPPEGRKKVLKSIKNKKLDSIISTQEPKSEEELPVAILSSYCVVIPSVTEGFGLSAAETCHLGVPLIVSDGGALPEVVSGKVLFFQNRNPRDLAEKILRACNNDFSSIPKKHFSYEQSTRQLLTVYESLKNYSASPSFAPLGQIITGK